MFFKRSAEKKEEIKGLRIQQLSYKEHGITRPVWESIFDEDSEAFVDFYYRHKTGDNTIWTVREGDEVVSMIQLNPYQVHLGRAIVPAHYIVGVATREEYRRQGLMRQLMVKSFRQLYDNKEAFTYLMPAKEAYYTPFDFVTVYEQAGGILSAPAEKTSDLVCRVIKEEELRDLVKFSEQVLTEKYQVFVSREEEYYQVLIEQFAAENGDLIGVYDKGMLIGFFFFAESDIIEIVESICLDRYKTDFTAAIGWSCKEFDKEIRVIADDFLDLAMVDKRNKKPATMIRIISLDILARYLRADKSIRLIIEVKDEWIGENNGVFAFSIGAQDSYFEETTEASELSLSIAELTELFFTKRRKEAWLSGDISDKLSFVKPFTPVFLNEFV